MKIGRQGVRAQKQAAAAVPVRSVRSVRRSTVQVAAAVHLDFNTKSFQKELVKFADSEEYIVRGGEQSVQREHHHLDSGAPGDGGGDQRSNPRAEGGSAALHAAAEPTGLPS